MSWISERLLYGLARAFYRTEVAHTRSMKTATSNPSDFLAYRANEARRVFDAAERYGVALRGRDILDLGCNDGALTAQCLGLGATRIVGVDIDVEAIGRARRNLDGAGLEFLVSTVDRIPLEDRSIDTILCFDVFEHVSQPARILEECRRVLRPGGQMLIGTWGWKHPFAPHLWSTMPVPWAHVLFSERTVLRTCRRVYQSDWYVPTLFDLDENGQKRTGRYLNESIESDYLNKFLIRDFERVFAESGLDWELHLLPFGSKYARWTKPLLRFRRLREYLTGFLWAVLTNPREEAKTPAPFRSDSAATRI